MFSMDTLQMTRNLFKGNLNYTFHIWMLNCFYWFHVDNRTKTFETLLCECNRVQSSRSRHSNQFESHQKNCLTIPSAEIFAEKVERAARWRPCWPCPLIWPDSYINWAPGSLASTGICSREDPLWKALCISGDCPYKFGALHPHCHIRALYGTPGVLNTWNSQIWP